MLRKDNVVEVWCILPPNAILAVDLLDWLYVLHTKAGKIIINLMKRTKEMSFDETVAEGRVVANTELQFLRQFTFSSVAHIAVVLVTRILRHHVGTNDPEGLVMANLTLLHSLSQLQEANCY